MLWDVIVVGGGASGLYAARLLKEAGLHVHVLEAQPRLGGRLHTIYSPEGHPIDLGGQWVGPMHQHVLAWCQKHDVPLHATYFAGRHRLITPKRTYTYKGTIPRLPLPALLSLGWGLLKIKAQARRVSAQAPWSLERPEWDEITLAAWRRKHLWHPLARSVFDIGLSTVLGCEPDEVSLWHTLFYIQSAGSLEALIETETGAQAYKFTLGASRFIETLAEGLSYETNAAVLRVERSTQTVTIQTAEQSYQARALLLAIPPAVHNRILWDPPLPPLWQQLGQRMPMGSITKVIAIYPKPFWREEGWSGHLLRTHGALRLTFDTSPPDASYGQITGFAVGPLARSLLTRPSPERDAFYTQEVTELFGQAPLFLYQKSWADEPYIGGCYVGFLGPGGWRYFGQTLRDHLPPLYGAGTERAAHWMGYIEGALHAAIQATDAIHRTGL